MKSLLLLLFSIAFLSVNAQQMSLISRIGLNTAAGEQRHKFRNAWGIGGGIEMAVKKNSPLKWFSHGDVATNGSTSEPHEFLFRNVVTNTDVDYTSYVVQLGTGLRYIFNQKGAVSPYAGVGGGLFLYRTQYTIHDPHDNDGCRPVESRNLLTNAAFAGRVEGGMRIASKWNVAPGRRLYLDFGFSYLRGTTARYINLSKHTPAAGGDAYYAKFQSPASSEVHEHAIGTTYRTAVNQLMFHAGVVIPLYDNKSKSCKEGQKRCQRSF